MDLSRELPEAISLNWEDEEWIQPIDYEQLPFRCRLCHEYGHLGRNYPIYGPSCFQEKHSFMGFLQWLQDQAEQGQWVLGGDFNLIANLEEKKGGRRTMDKFQEPFSECLARGPLVDMETGSG